VLWRVVSMGDVLLSGYHDYDYTEEELAEPDFYVDQFYGGGMDQEESDDDLGGGLAPFSVSEILEHCIEPTVTDGLKHMGKIIVWCLLFRLTTQTVQIPASLRGTHQVVPWLSHVASILSGTLLASHFFGVGVFYLVGLVLLGYTVLTLTRKGRRGPFTALLIVSLNIGAETYLVDPVTWHQVRGAVMIVAMKIISLGFDMDAASEEVASIERERLEQEIKEEEKKGVKIANIAKHKTGKRNGKKTAGEDVEEEKVELIEEPYLAVIPGWLEYSGYCLCPGTVVLGPWVSFQEYRDIFYQPRWNITWAVKILFTIMFAFMFLTISTCWNPWLIPDSGWKWWLAYRDAMSFRASHYFVSFMSEASLIAAGFGCTVSGSQVLWHYTVTQPHTIEVPRSLAEVVVGWNLPMHRWLKHYVFKQARVRLGSGAAVLLTYLTSTLLHGLSGQLAAVLLSLGFYTRVEHSLRQKLAGILDASIAARKETDGRRKYREGSTWVILVNLIFGLVTMFHLAYLGVMFDQSNPDQVSGYSWSHTLSKWRHLEYRSHYLVAGMAFVNWLL